MQSILKIATGLLILCGIAFTSCSTVTKVSSTNEIKSEQMVLNTYLDRNDYTIIGTVSGTSEFVSFNAETGEWTGDSGNYGYIYEPAETFIGQTENGNGKFVGVGKKASNTSESEALQRAKLNANFIMIEEAYKLGGDSILSPIYTVEKHSEESKNGSYVKSVSYKVSVRAKVIQIKTK